MLIELHEIKVKNLFVDLDHQAEILIALYKMVIPDYDRLVEMQGWPAVNNYTWEEIALLFVDFDKDHHPEVFSGGLWLNRGFTTGDAPDWTADLSKCELIYPPHPLISDIYTVIEKKSTLETKG
jgi:hypothetical protein